MPPCSLAFIVPTDERGTTWSTFEYARHSAAALNLKPLILFAHTKQPGVLARWIENFDTVASYDLSRTRFSITNASGGARRLDDIVGWLQSRNARGVSIQTHGSPIKGLPGRGEFNIMALPARGIPLLVHAVFSAKHPWPNATFARISAVVPAASSAIPVVPYPVAPALVRGPDRRASLGLPADATVFCRHGGMATFNVPFVRTAVARFAERRPDVYFVLLNTPRLDSKTRANVVHLPAIFDEAKKAGVHPLVRRDAPSTRAPRARPSGWPSPSSRCTTSRCSRTRARPPPRATTSTRWATAHCSTTTRRNC